MSFHTLHVFSILLGCIDDHLQYLKRVSFSEPYNYAVSRIGWIVQQCGRTLAGWDDISEAELPADSLLYNWHADKNPAGKYQDLLVRNSYVNKLLCALNINYHD